MAVKYLKSKKISPFGHIWNAEEEVGKISGLRARCDSDLAGSIRRCITHVVVVAGTDPLSENRKAPKSQYWLTRFAAQLRNPSALVASFRDGATPSQKGDELVVYAVLAENAPDDDTIDNVLNHRIAYN